MTKFRIIGTSKTIGDHRHVYYRVQIRKWFLLWEDLQIVESPFLEYESPSAVAAERTLLLWDKSDGHPITAAELKYDDKTNSYYLYENKNSK